MPSPGKDSGGGASGPFSQVEVSDPPNPPPYKCEAGLVDQKP